MGKLVGGRADGLDVPGLSHTFEYVAVVDGQAWQHPGAWKELGRTQRGRGAANDAQGGVTLKSLLNRAYRLWDLYEADPTNRGVWRLVHHT